MSRKALVFIEYVLIIVLLMGLGTIIYTQYIKVDDKTMKNHSVLITDESTGATKLVLYEGPKTLRSATEEDLKATSESLRDFSLLKCTDTLIQVDGYDCFVYDTNVNHTREWVGNFMPPISRTPITYFDFEGTVTVTIQVPNIDIEEIQISPLSYGITPVVDVSNHQVTFDINEADTYTVTFNNSPVRAIHVFANPIETDLPDFNDENVIYIGPGEWDIETIDLKSNQTLYIAGGAVIHGVVQANHASNVKVMGRGIIDGSFFDGWKGQVAYIPLKFDNCDQITIQDILVLNSNAWVCQAYESTNGIIDGLKIISPRPNGDGITLQSCKNYMVSNCFVRSWDDSLVVKNFASSSNNITFSNMQLWTDLAQSMEIGYETNKGNISNASISQIIFEDITVLNNFHKPVISIHNADDADIYDITFRDIIVENAQMGTGDGADMPYLIDINIDQSTNWSTTRERGTIRDVLIENVEVLSGLFNTSRIEGYDETHKVESVQIKNLIILGQLITDAEMGKFTIDPLTTNQITFN